MTINPRDYDLDELRKMARKRGAAGPVADDEEGVPGPDPDPDPDPDVEWEPLEESTATDDSFRARLYRELMPLAASNDSLEKPYLSTLPETHAAEFLVFEWLEFLLFHGGFRGAREALTYYESIGWITEEVTGDLDDYLLGIDDQASHGGENLDVDDHLLSLVYIAKLVAMT